ncbi:huntingtin-interacting protein 1-related protein-like [Gadus chalcogrammus]|uniref:huntingtin-interacting protein 1-related protein-like n=1 Tax=Gadus chalcogrammus TaxID=1042646 RepID=UPI0024C487B4|nr:huntingtin-interacting protein 1-related protein-like [Gadus chalcogrammus]
MLKSKSKADKTEKVLAAEKEQFGKQQLHSITKTLTAAETPLKEKYARNIILGTHKESGATTFMSYCQNLPLSSSSVISWKYCYMLHKVLRDGHPNAVRDCNRRSRNVRDMGILWGNLHDRYGHLVALSAKYLCLKMEFHVKHKCIPGNLEASDEAVEREAGSDKNQVLDMTQELLEYLDNGLKFADTVLRQVDAIGAKSTTASGQCRLAPLIPVILDSSFLYHFSVILLFKLHSRISPDSLLGHRERFRDLFTSLTEFYNRTREIEFFKTIIQIPDLPDSPPNFLRAAAFAEYKRPVVVVGDGEPHEEEEAGGQPEPRDAPQNQQYYSVNQYGLPEAQEQRETEILRKELLVLKPELQLIKTEVSPCVMELKGQVNRLEAQLEEQTTHKQMALVGNEQLRMEVEALRCTGVANAGAQVGYKEADTRAQAAEMRFSQLKERHAELVTSHADLMKKNAETVRVLSGMKNDKDDMQITKQQVSNELDRIRQENRAQMEKQQQEMERMRNDLLAQKAELDHARSALGQKEMEGSQLSGLLAGLQAERDMLLRSASDKDAELSSLRQQAHSLQSSLDQERDRHSREMEALRAQLQQQLAINAEQKLEIDRLRRELDQARMQASNASTALQTKEMVGSQLSGTLAGLQAEREVLLRSVRDKDSELASLRQQSQLQQSSLDQHRQMAGMELGSLQAQLQQQACREGELTRKLQEEQFCLLQCAVVEAEGIVLDAMAKIDDPIHVRCTSSPDYLVSRAEVALGSIDKMHQNQLVYMGNMSDASGLLRAVTQFSHLAADTIVNGAAASHSAPTDHADRLTDGCRDCSAHCLQFLKELKLQSTLPRADPTAMRYAVQRILALGQELQPRGRDVLKEMGDMVDKEMVATSTAIEEAVLRMDEIMSQARRDTTGIKLEVNQSILGSCSDLMKAIHMLVTAATDLQKDIVESGRGAASADEFYAKNSRWTEGLISASKAVGWGATQILESADRVVSHNGKYEELIACSHEIAASTAQLVASSKVKADRNNKKLYTLQQASRHVNDMTAVVVTSTKHGQQQVTEKAPMDFTGRSLIKLKKMEMEAQVKVLELESELEQERVRLGELRKKHYDMAGDHQGEPERGGDGDGADSFPPPPPPTLLPELPSTQTHPYQSSTAATTTTAAATATTSTTTQGLGNSNPFLKALTEASLPPSPPSSSLSSSATAASTPLSTSQLFTPTPQPYTAGQPFTPGQTYAPYTPSTQPYTPSTQPYTPSTQPYTPSTQSHTPSTQPYTPSTQPYTPSSTPNAAFNPTQSSTKPQGYLPSPLPTLTVPTSLNPVSKQKTTPQSSPTPARRPNIFTKSGNLLKNAFRKSEAGSGES